MKALARSPTPARQSAFRARRAVARALRRRREARGDFSRSYPALHEIDRQLEARLTGPGGFFLEAGGNDGFTQSNTYALEPPPRGRGYRLSSPSRPPPRWGPPTGGGGSSSSPCPSSRAPAPWSAPAPTSCAPR